MTRRVAKIAAGAFLLALSGCVSDYPFVAGAPYYYRLSTDELLGWVTIRYTPGEPRIYADTHGMHPRIYRRDFDADVYFRASRPVDGGELAVAIQVDVVEPRWITASEVTFHAGALATELRPSGVDPGLCRDPDCLRGERFTAALTAEQVKTILNGKETVDISVETRSEPLEAYVRKQELEALLIRMAALEEF